MKTLRIPKRSGGFRTVVCPSHREKILLRCMLPKLHAIAILCDVHGVSHGFTPGRSPVTNAACHVGFRYTLSADLADCFDHVRKDHISVVLGVGCSWSPWWSQAFVDGVARQGLPTSPVIANIALSGMDAEIVKRLRKLDPKAVYTRYADDLTISSDSLEVLNEILEQIREPVSKAGQSLAGQKTKIQCAASGRRIITGVAVDDKGVYPTRAVKRRLRAAKHQNNTPQAEGLAEWCKLRKPQWFKKAVLLLDGTIDEQQLALLITNREKECL